MPVSLTPKGTGRPDYSIDIGKSTASANVIKEYKLKPNEKLKIFQLVFTDVTSAYPFVRSPLAPTERVSLMDGETGLPMPFTVPAGYDFRVLKYWFNSNESLRLEMYFDGQLISTMFPGDLYTYFEQDVALFRVSWFDPDLSSSHTMDIQAVNEGTTDAYGHAIVYAILEKVR